MIPYVEITLDKPRRLRFGMGAALSFERTTGIKLTSLGDEISFEVCAQLLHAMIKQDSPGLTLEHTVALVDEHSDNLMDIMTAVTKAIEVAFQTGAKDPNVKTPEPISQNG